MYTFRPHVFGLLIALLCLCSPPAQGQTEDVVRIKLFDLSEPTAVRVGAHDGPVRLYAGDFTDPISEIRDGSQAVIARASNQLHIQQDGAGIFATGIRMEPAPGGRIALSVEEGKSQTKPRYYEGTVRIAVHEGEWELSLINEVGLEDYVAAVVASEYGFDDLEGAKAMAVIIRTYTLAVLNKYGSEFDHVDHTLSQVYRGTERVTPTIREAVRATRGEVLSYRDRLIEAVYFSASGGHTADNETVWTAEAVPYLRGKPDPYGGSAPHAAWTVRISRPRLLAALSEAYGDVTGFVIGERGEGGRVTSIELLKSTGQRQTIRSNDFRMIVLRQFGAGTLRSTLFTARRDGEEYVFEGKGNGHGVGLSQWGAHELAQRNTSYREILDFYYTGVRLESLDELRARQVQPHVAAEPKEEPRRSSVRIGW